MTSIFCPKCKSHISDFDLVCLKCGYTITPEEREQLLKEHEELLARKAEAKRAMHEEEMKLKHKHRIQKKLDRFSFRALGVTLDVVTVFVIALILIAVVTVLMLM